MSRVSATFSALAPNGRSREASELAPVSKRAQSKTHSHLYAQKQSYPQAT